MSAVPDLPTEPGDSSSGAARQLPPIRQPRWLPWPQPHGKLQGRTASRGGGVLDGRCGGSTIVTDPDVEWVDGILRGTVGATSTRDLPSPTPWSTHRAWAARSLSPPTIRRGSSLPGRHVGGDQPVGDRTVQHPGRGDHGIRPIPVEHSDPGLFVPSLLTTLHQIPILGNLLAPIIGASEVVQFSENAYTLAADRPVAFTYMMPSFDGTLISVNYFRRPTCRPAMSTRLRWC